MQELLKYVQKLQHYTEQYIQRPTPANYERFYECSEIVKFIVDNQLQELQEKQQSPFPELILN